jgi:hypothetical protein
VFGITELSNCGSLRTLPPFPHTLLNLFILCCDEVETLNLPSDLEELSCEGCDNLELDLSKLPPQLNKLSIRWCDRMRQATQLDQLPAHLKDLELERFDKLVSLPSPPSGLHSLCWEHCESLAFSPIIPESLRKLTLEWLPELKDMMPLPDYLEELSLSRCRKLKELDHIPHKLKLLKIDQMDLLQILSFNLPQILEHLEISNSPNIESDFVKYSLEMESHTGSPFPPNLGVLVLYGLKGLKILPALPISLEKLVLKDCKSKIEFPVLPPNLKELEISYCDQIKFIGSDDISLERIGFRGKMPRSLKKIDLNFLTNLVWIGELPSNLESLSIDKCNSGGSTMSSLPQHLQYLRIED